MLKQHRPVAAAAGDHFFCHPDRKSLHKLMSSPVQADCWTVELKTDKRHQSPVQSVHRGSRETHVMDVQHFLQEYFNLSDSAAAAGQEVDAAAR